MRLAGAVALMLVSIAAAASVSHLDPRDGAVLSESVAQQALHQCSRGVPQNVTGTWLPDRVQIAELESRLPAALEAIALQRGGDYGGSSKFRRQYAGLLVHGRKIIYVNAFPHGVAGEFQQQNWHQAPIVVCDGGPAFFGVEYDPATKTFSHFAFNGAI